MRWTLIPFGDAFRHELICRPCFGWLRYEVKLYGDVEGTRPTKAGQKHYD
jgi:hypothetical protein